MRLKKIQTISDKLFWQFIVFSSNFGLPQAKGNLIFISINFVYELIRELPNNLKLTILEYHDIDKKSRKWVGKHTKAQSLFQDSIFGNSEYLTSAICPGLAAPASPTLQSYPPWYETILKGLQTKNCRINKEAIVKEIARLKFDKMFRK